MLSSGSFSKIVVVDHMLRPPFARSANKNVKRRSPENVFSAKGGKAVVTLFRGKDVILSIPTWLSSEAQQHLFASRFVLSTSGRPDNFWPWDTKCKNHKSVNREGGKILSGPTAKKNIISGGREHEKCILLSVLFRYIRTERRSGAPWLLIIVEHALPPG